MSDYAFRIVNVFAESPLAGQSAVRVRGCPRPRRRHDAGAGAAVQPVRDHVRAALDRGDGARCGSSRRRFEMPFAGHPTLGTAHVVRALAGAGDALRLRDAGGRDPGHRRRATSGRCRPMRRSTVRSTPAGRSSPRCWASPETTSRLDVGAAAVGRHRLRAAGDPARLRRRGAARGAARAGAAARTAATARRAMAYVWAFDPERASARPANGRCSRASSFPKHGAIVEDPGTGSACANLGGWLLATGAALPQRLAIAQGEAVGRPCRLGLEVTADRRILVSGRVIELGRGTIRLP